MHTSLVLCVLSLGLLEVVVEGWVVLVATPVLSTYTDGGGVDEMQVPQSGVASRTYEVCKNCVVNAGWIAPYENAGDMKILSHIDVEPQDNTVVLSAAGYAITGRVRIKVYADICD